MHITIASECVCEVFIFTCLNKYVHCNTVYWSLAADKKKGKLLDLLCKETEFWSACQKLDFIRKLFCENVIAQIFDSAIPSVEKKLVNCALLGFKNTKNIKKMLKNI